jgi:hypothetical protein
MHELFAVHKLNEDGLQRAKNLANEFDSLLTKVAEMVPEGREMSIVKTKLEEACFFAKKGMAKDKKNQEGA